MNNKALEQCMRLSYLLPERNAYNSVMFYKKLLRLAHKLTSIDTHVCNGTRYTGEGESEKATAAVYKQIATLLDSSKGINISWYHQSDPRGASLYVSDKLLTAENYTNGIAIY